MPPAARERPASSSGRQALYGGGVEGEAEGGSGDGEAEGVCDGDDGLLDDDGDRVCTAGKQAGSKVVGW